MSLRIQTNMEAFNAHRNLVSTSEGIGKAMERLSSGYRINRAADDAAGLAISERLKAQVKGIGQAQRNVQDAVSVVQTAEGALNEVHSMLQRTRELAVQYKNGSLSENDKTSIQSEVNQLASEVAQIGEDTEFNGIKLLKEASTITFQVGANDGETISVATVSLGEAVKPAAFELRQRRRSETDRRSDRIGFQPARRIRCGAEPPRTHPQQPVRLPGKPERLGKPHPRCGHGLRNGRIHEAADPAAGRHGDAGPGPAVRVVGAFAAPGLSAKGSREGGRPGWVGRLFLFLRIDYQISRSLL